MSDSPLKRPSALLPIAMSCAALGLVLGHVALYGIVHAADEGTPAHLFQLLMAAQVPVILFFAVRWLPRAPKQALLVLALQAVAALAAFAAVFFLT
jgi:MFS superfamily sulfate permease-like transporter